MSTLVTTALRSCCFTYLNVCECVIFLGLDFCLSFFLSACSSICWSVWEPAGYFYVLLANADLPSTATAVSVPARPDRESDMAQPPKTLLSFQSASGAFSNLFCESNIQNCFLKDLIGQSPECNGWSRVCFVKVKTVLFVGCHVKTDLSSVPEERKEETEQPTNQQPALTLLVGQQANRCADIFHSATNESISMLLFCFSDLCYIFMKNSLSVSLLNAFKFGFDFQ